MNYLGLMNIGDFTFNREERMMKDIVRLLDRIKP